MSLSFPPSGAKEKGSLEEDVELNVLPISFDDNADGGELGNGGRFVEEVGVDGRAALLWLHLRGSCVPTSANDFSNDGHNGAGADENMFESLWRLEEATLPPSLKDETLL